MGQLQGKVALVTGGARGQGAAEARLFHTEGATVVVADVADDDGERVAAEVEGTYLHLDVTSEAAWDATVDAVVAAHGRIDVVVNNAGIYANRRIVELDLATWERVIAVNQTGVFLGMRAVARSMIATGTAGSIVNISSLAGLLGPVGGTAYAASKWAVRGMTKIAAKELGRHGIRVNSVHPGLIDTDMLDQTPQGGANRDRATAAVPLRRLGTAEDCARLVLFLASDASAYCTGQEFTVDGGLYPPS